MASFLDKFADKVNSISNKVVEKTTNGTENIRLSNSIKDEERQINNDYIAIGKKYIELFGKSPAPEFAEFVNDIKKREVLISEYRNKIKQNKGKVNCQNCGAEIDTTAAFCDKCGAKNPVAEQIAREKAEAEAKAAAEAAAKAQAQAQAQAQAAAAQAAATQEQVNAVMNNPSAPQPLNNTENNNAENNSTNKVFCKNCGNEIINGNIFCTNCGTRISE